MENNLSFDFASRLSNAEAPQHNPVPTSSDVPDTDVFDYEGETLQNFYEPSFELGGTPIFGWYEESLNEAAGISSSQTEAAGQEEDGLRAVQPLITTGQDYEASDWNYTNIPTDLFPIAFDKNLEENVALEDEQVTSFGIEESSAAIPTASRDNEAYYVHAQSKELAAFPDAIGSRELTAAFPINNIDKESIEFGGHTSFKGVNDEDHSNKLSEEDFIPHNVLPSFSYGEPLNRSGTMEEVGADIEVNAPTENECSVFSSEMAVDNSLMIDRTTEGDLLRFSSQSVHPSATTSWPGLHEDEKNDDLFDHLTTFVSASSAPMNPPNSTSEPVLVDCAMSHSSTAVVPLRSWVHALHNLDGGFSSNKEIYSSLSGESQIPTAGDTLEEIQEQSEDLNEDVEFGNFVNANVVGPESNDFFKSVTFEVAPFKPTAMVEENVAETEFSPFINVPAPSQSKSFKVNEVDGKKTLLELKQVSNQYFQQILEAVKQKVALSGDWKSPNDTEKCTALSETLDAKIQRYSKGINVDEEMEYQAGLNPNFQVAPSASALPYDADFLNDSKDSLALSSAFDVFSSTLQEEINRLIQNQKKVRGKSTPYFKGDLNFPHSKAKENFSSLVREQQVSNPFKIGLELPKSLLAKSLPSKVLRLGSLVTPASTTISSPERSSSFVSASLKMVLDSEGTPMGMRETHGELKGDGEAIVTDAAEYAFTTHTTHPQDTTTPNKSQNYAAATSNIFEEFHFSGKFAHNGQN